MQIHALSSAYARALSAGYDRHIAKPIEINELLEVIAGFASQDLNKQ